MQILKGSYQLRGRSDSACVSERVCDIPTVGHAPAPYKSNRLHSSCTNPDGKVKEQKVHSLDLISSPPSLPKERGREKRGVARKITDIGEALRRYLFNSSHQSGLSFPSLNCPLTRMPSHA